MIVRWKGAIPPAASSRRTEGTCRPITRISSFAGRVTEAALHRKVKPGAERVGLWPAVTRKTCSDVLRVRRGDRRCPWRQQAGAHGGSMLSRKRSCRTRILDSLAPQPTRRHVSRKGQTNAALLAGLHPGHRSTLGAPPAARKGLRGGSLFTGAIRNVRKQVEASVMRRTITRLSAIPRGIHHRVARTREFASAT
jgi:hypothetical protein